MSISKRFTTAAVAVSLIAGSLAPLSTSALADGWDDRGHQGYDQGYGYGRDREWNVESDRRYRGFQQYAAPRQDYRADNSYHDDRADRREHRRDRKLARGVAIGLGVLMLGAILSQAGNRRDRHDY